MTHWGDPVTREPIHITFDDIQAAGYHGFVYLIENNVSGRMYIGRKRMTQRLSRPPLKGKKNRRHYVKESDWRTYTGSCAELNEDIAAMGVNNFTFQILSFHTSQTEMNYHEMAEQFLRNVLEARFANGEKLFYNDNIAQQFYSSEANHATRMLLFT